MLEFLVLLVEDSIFWFVDSFNLIVCSADWIESSISRVIDYACSFIDSVVSVKDSADWIIDSFVCGTDSVGCVVLWVQ